MKVTLFPCGPAANESELKAFEHLKGQLQSNEGDGEWVLLTNLTLSINHQLQSDEIDIVAIGPSGVRVIEVKHWTPQWIDSHSDIVGHEAERVTSKARKIGTTLRQAISRLPRVDGAILLTQEAAKVRRFADKMLRGVRFYALNEWKALLDLNSPKVLEAHEVVKLARILEPGTAVAIDGSLRRLAGYVNLELQTPREERFHRVYKGSHSSRQDRVILHLYDLSAGDDVLKGGNRSGARTLSLKAFVHVLHNRYGLCVDMAPPGMTISNDLLQANRAILERRLRDLGLLAGVNDAEAMKRLKPRFEPIREDANGME